MTKNTVFVLWWAIDEYMKENGHSMESLKRENPFAEWYGSRAISYIKKAALGDGEASLNFNKVKGLLEFLNVDHYIDGNVIFAKKQYKND